MEIQITLEIRYLTESLDKQFVMKTGIENYSWDLVCL